MLSDLLERIMQAERRLRRPGVARIARLLVDRFWAPVGSGVQPDGELVFMAGHLFGDDEGRAAARRVDETIRRLPGFADVGLLEAWMQRHAGAANVPNGGRHGHGHH